MVVRKIADLSAPSDVRENEACVYLPTSPTQEAESVTPDSETQPRAGLLFFASRLQ